MRQLRLLVPVFFAAMLAACGGSSSSHSSPAPIFTSTPVTTAEQGVAYSYDVAATDPAGGTVTFALSAEPSGATMSGSTVSWTPSAAEARVANNFTVTATTSSGGSAQQSWSVTPNGTVTVNWVSTYWSPSGQVQVPAPSSAASNIEALVAQADGSITLLKGSATSTPGVFTIANVPGGNYWLAAGGGGAFWTDTATFDAGTDIAGGQTPFTTANSTQFNFDVNITAETSEEYLEYFTDPPTGAVEFGDPAGSTTAMGGVGSEGTVDWSQINTAFLMQYVPESIGSQNTFVLGPELTLTGLTFTDGGTNNIDGTLNAATEASLDLSVPGSQWAPLFNNAGPATATPETAILMLTAEPYVTGVNASPGIAFPALELVNPTAGGLGFIVENSGVELLSPESTVCQDFTGELGQLVTVLNPPILTDEDLGTLQYGDPFDPTWTRAMALCQEATVPITLPGSSEPYSFLLVDGATVAPSSSALAPTALPVVSPTINGASLLTAATIDTVVPTLSWTAPTGVTPYGYKVRAYIQAPINGEQALIGDGVYSTAATSITLPPLAGGNTYVFTITTEVDGAANVQTSPYRSALPAGFASIVSAPITISPSSAAPRIQGEIEEWRRIVSPQGKSQAKPGGSRPTTSTCAVTGHSLGHVFCE